MKVFVNKNQKLRELHEPQTFHASVLGNDGFLYRERIDMNDLPNVFNIERHSVLSMTQETLVVTNIPDKNIPNHHSRVSTLIKQKGI